MHFNVSPLFAMLFEVMIWRW